MSELLNASEAAHTLSLSRSTIFKLSMAGRIPHFKFGRRILFDRAELLEWFKGNYRVPLVADEPPPSPARRMKEELSRAQ